MGKRYDVDVHENCQLQDHVEEIAFVEEIEEVEEIDKFEKKLAKYKRSK